MRCGWPGVLIALVIVAVGGAGGVARTMGVPAPAQAPARAGWTLQVLGIAQDGGIPHLGCDQARCVAAREGRRRPERVSSLGLVHAETGRAYVFDATPDLPVQIHALTGGRPPDGIFLTHAHIGHYLGLAYLGKESIGAAGVPVYGTARMVEYLTANGPWRLLVEDANIDLRPIVPDTPVTLPDGLSVTPLLVPHRDELTDTVGFRIDGPRASALYIPDVDRWDRWDRDLREVVDSVDVAFLDGTFSSPGEIGRDLGEIPHPMIPETRELVRDAEAEVWFIHLNHTNPALDRDDDVARQGMEFEL